MSSTSDSSKVSAQDLLAIDKISDAFEAELRSGVAEPIEFYLEQISPSRRGRLKKELLKIQKEYSRDPQKTVNDRSPAGALDIVNVSQRFAHYSLMKLLGVGSFGEVWKAYDNRLHRVVALKMQRSGFAEDADRFLREAKASARLSHPNIVRILEVGEYEGRLYIVREYVEGQSLSELLSSGTMGNERCAEIALQVAEALEYSHAAGCIHRDLKPQNILLNQKGEALLTDFGLAKSSVTSTSPTLSGEIIGSPAYMSPEQARGRSHEADGRADVWSLGVILYQMLTSETPFRGSCEMVLLQILRDDPVDPRQLRKDASADLATISLRCLEKEPRKRYNSASDLKLDLQRFLAHQPIEARPISRLGKAWRWCHRNRSVAALLATVGSLLLAITFGSLIAASKLATLWKNESALREAALVETQQARTQERIALEVTQFMESVFVASDPVGSEILGLPSGGKDVTAKELLERALVRVREEFSSQPRLQSRLMDAIANVCRSLGLLKDAEKLLSEAERMRRPLQADAVRDPYLMKDFLTHDFYLGCLCQAQGQTKEAQQIFATTKSAAVSLVGEKDLFVADIQFQEGWLALEAKQPQIAADRFQEALAIRTQLLPAGNHALLLAQLAYAQANSTEKYVLPSTLEIANELNNSHSSELLKLAVQIQLSRASKQYDRAERLYRQALKELEQILAADDPRLLLAKGDFAALLFEMGYYDEAMQTIMPVLESARRTAPQHPQFASALVHVGTELMMATRFEESEKLLREGIQIGLANVHLEYEAMSTLISVLIVTGRGEEAIAWSDKSRSLNLVHTRAKAWRAYIHSKALESNNRQVEALDSLGAAVEYADQCDRNTIGALALQRLGVIYFQAKMLDKSLEVRKLALERELADRPAMHPKISDQLQALGGMYLEMQQPEQAISLLQRALEIREARLPTGDERIGQSRSMLVTANLQQARTKR